MFKIKYSIIKNVFWPVLTLCLLLFFVVIPISKVGLWKYATDQMEINPFVAKLMNKYTYYQSKRLSEDWYNRVQEISGGANPEG